MITRGQTIYATGSDCHYTCAAVKLHGAGRKAVTVYTMQRADGVTFDVPHVQLTLMIERKIWVTD